MCKSNLLVLIFNYLFSSPISSSWVRRTFCVFLNMLISSSLHVRYYLFIINKKKVWLRCFQVVNECEVLDSNPRNWGKRRRRGDIVFLLLEVGYIWPSVISNEKAKRTVSPCQHLPTGPTQAKFPQGFSDGPMQGEQKHQIPRCQDSVVHLSKSV